MLNFSTAAKIAFFKGIALKNNFINFVKRSQTKNNIWWGKGCSAE